MSIDNNLLSKEGLDQIGDDFKNLGRNLTQVARGLKNNILTQSIVNTLRDEGTNLITEMQRYVALDSLITSLSNDQELLLALNGLTNLNSKEMLGVLGEVVNYASAKDGLNASLSLYNNETYTKGYAYSTKTNRGEKEEWIGFNTRSNDLTKPHEVINTIFHESSSKNKHHHNEGYANARGKSAQSNYFLRNYGNKNTNALNTQQWNLRENLREKQQGGGVLQRGNAYNTRAYLGELSEKGERDERTIGVAFRASKFTADYVSKYKKIPSLEELKKFAGREWEGIKEDADTLLNDPSYLNKLYSLVSLGTGINPKDVYKSISSEENKSLKQEGKKDEGGEEKKRKNRNKPQQTGEINSVKFGQDKNGGKKYTEFDSEGNFVKEVRQKGGHGYKENTVKEKVRNQGKDGKIYEGYRVRKARPDEIPQSWK